MIHLITYGNKYYNNSKKRLYNEALSSGWFNTITLYGPEDLDDEFTLNFKDILRQQKGGGYWIWKPYIIKKHLDKLQDNDILISHTNLCVSEPSMYVWSGVYGYVYIHTCMPTFENYFRHPRSVHTCIRTGALYIV
jgi:hypothetical protein